MLGHSLELSVQTLADPLYSDYLRDPSQLGDPNTDYTAVNTLLGHGTTTQPAAMLGLTNMSLRLPPTVVFFIEGGEDYIHISHSPSLYPADTGTTTPFENHVVVLVEDAASSSLPVVLLDNSFSLPTAHPCTKSGTLPPIFGLLPS